MYCVCARCEKKIKGRRYKIWDSDTYLSFCPRCGLIEILDKYLCKLGLHSWGKWDTNSLRWGYVIRYCYRCHKRQDERLF